MTTTKIDSSGVTFPDATVQATAALGTASGSYVGDDTVNRAIPHGLGVTPKIVLLRADDWAYFWVIFGAIALIKKIQGAGVANVDTAVTIPDATNFYVGNAGNQTAAANESDGDPVFQWVAMG